MEYVNKYMAIFYFVLLNVHFDPSVDFLFFDLPLLSAYNGIILLLIQC